MSDRFLARLKSSGLVLALFAVASTSHAAGNLGKIMPLGDSITGGAAKYAGYRYPLFYKLRDAGYTFDFVGATSEWKYNGDTVYDRDSEGWGGWKIEDLAYGKAGTNVGNARQWLSTYKPDTTMLMAGTNDSVKSQAGYEASYDKLLTEVYAGYAATTVILSTVIPSAPATGKAKYEVYLRDAVISTVSRWQAKGYKITLIDSYTGFDTATMLAPGDNYHPNAIGHDFIASRFYDALVAPVPEPASFAALAGGVLVLLRRRKR